MSALRPALPEAVPARPAEVPGEKAEKARKKLGSTTSATLLEHIPRDRRAAPHARRTDARRDRDRRRRGPLDHEPAGAPARHEADGRGARRRRDGHDAGDVLQPAVARAPLPARHAAAADGQARAAATRGFVVIEHAETGEQVATGEDMATYPASDGLTSVQIAALAHEHRRGPRRARAAPGPHPGARTPPGPLGGARRRPLRRPGGRPTPAGLRRVPAAADRAAAPPRAAPRGRPRRRRSSRPAS